MRKSKGFTLVELLVVVGIIAMLVGILMPTLGRAREIAQMSMCAANLNAIGKGIQMFMAESEDKFPLLWTDGNPMENLNSGTDNDDVTKLNRNYMQNVWAMIKNGSIQEDHFVCASDKQQKDRKDCESSTTNVKKYGWNAWENFSFGMHKPYDTNMNSHKSPLTTSKSGNFVIFADKNYRDDQKAGSVYYRSDNDRRKPGNHPRDGLNYLTYGASVQKARYDEGRVEVFSTVGVNGDDIYLAGDNAGQQSPKDAVATANPTLDTDTFILPWQVSGGSSGPGI